MSKPQINKLKNFMITNEFNINQINSLIKNIESMYKMYVPKLIKTKIGSVYNFNFIIDTNIITKKENNHILRLLLMNLFKYKKIDNKPVFAILHYYCWSAENYNKYVNYLNKKCTEYGFSGIYTSIIAHHDIQVNNDFIKKRNIRRGLEILREGCCGDFSFSVIENNQSELKKPQKTFNLNF